MGGNSSKEQDPEPTNVNELENTTFLDRGARTTKKSNYNNFGRVKTTQGPNSTILHEAISTVVSEATPTPDLITATTKGRSKTTSRTKATSSSDKDYDSENSSSSSWLPAGIIIGIIAAIIILILFIRKNNKKKRENESIPTYQNNNVKTLKPTPPKTSDSELYSGPIYDPSKENDYSTMNYNNTTPSMGVATSVDAATIQRKNEEIEAAKAAFSHATLPNFNSVQKQDSSSSLPEITGAQSFNYGQSYDQYNQTQPTIDSSYNQPQPTIDSSYIQPQPTIDSSYNQPQTTYDNSYNQQPAYSQPQPAYDPAGYNQPQQAYDPAGFNQPQPAFNAGGFNQPQSFDTNGYNSVTSSPYGAQYANYTPGASSVNQSTVTSPLALPVSPAGGVIVSATYSSSQTTSVKQPDGTVTETVDYSTNNTYEVDKDYVAIYSYEPNMSDELTININDRIHLLEMYSDGWGYGKNVTTGQIGILPLNRLKVEDDKEKEKDDPAEKLRKKNLTVEISKRTVSRYRKPKKDDDYDGKKKSKKRYSDGDDDYDRKRYSDDDDYERRRERRRRDSDDDYERRRERRRHDDDDDYERRRDRRRHDDDDYERRRDRRRYSDDDDYERRRDRRRYSDDDDYERRRDRRRYSDDDYDRKERRRSNSSERKSNEDRDVEKKTSEDKENKKSVEDESKKSDDNGIVEYEIKSYRKD